MTYLSLTEKAHQIARQHLNEGSIAVDCTIGNGHDLLFLARQVGATGFVYGFDIQPSSLNVASEKIVQQQLSQRVKLFQSCHSHLAELIDSSHEGLIDVIMFNLGYLPGSDKSIITETTSTLKALQSGITLLSEGGLVTVMAYPGHSGGRKESEAVNQFCLSLNPAEIQVTVFDGSGKSNVSPRLYCLRSQK